MTPYVIRLTEDAEADLERIGEYIAATDSSSRAAYVIAEIRRVIAGLRSFPERGPMVSELLDAGQPGYRELLFKPYRIIYRVTDDSVYVHLIADGRRDMRTLLWQRLLRA